MAAVPDLPDLDSTDWEFLLDNVFAADILSK
jgi:hypothetical protein